MPKDWKVAEWELKPWSFKLKYAAYKHPVLFATLPVYLIICPLIVWSWKYRFDLVDGRYQLYHRFKKAYVVLRDDDPDCAKVRRVENPQPMYTLNFPV